MRFKTRLSLATVSALALAGCEQDPYSGDPNANTKQGLIGGTDRLGKAATGAAVSSVARSTRRRAICAIR